MRTTIQNWFLRNFKVITLEKALELKLKHECNIYGDQINFLNCRSIWSDEKDRTYRVKVLFICDNRELNDLIKYDKQSLQLTNRTKSPC